MTKNYLKERYPNAIVSTGSKTWDTCKRDNGKIEVISYSGITKSELIDFIAKSEDVEKEDVIFS